MNKLFLLYFLCSFSSFGQYIKQSTFSSSGIAKGAFASQIIGQSSVVSGGENFLRQGFKQPLQLTLVLTNRLPAKVAMEDDSTKWTIDVYPNPFVDVLHVKLRSDLNQSTTLFIYDYDANLVWQGFFDEKHKEFSIQNLQNLSPGKYIMKVYHNGISQTKSIIKSVQ